MRIMSWIFLAWGLGVVIGIILILTLGLLLAGKGL